MNLAKVLAGHDKNHYYLILEEREEYVLLVNGTTKPLARPKKKNKKHIQIIKRIPEHIIISEAVSQGDTKIAELLQQYQQYLAGTGQKTQN